MTVVAVIEFDTASCSSPRPIAGCLLEDLPKHPTFGSIAGLNEKDHRLTTRSGQG